MPELLLPFLALVALITITPGPDTVLVLRNGVRGGSPIAWATGIGCCTGIGVHALAAVLGLSAIIAASAEAFTVLKIAGALYLVWLGASSIIATLRRRREPVARIVACERPGEREPGRAEAFRQGMASNLLNPKIAILFLTLLPQFISPGEPRVATTMILAASFIAIGLVWMRLISLAIGPIAGTLSRGTVARWFERATGALLVAVGVRVGIEQR